ncbi:hypothetical protein Q3G72_018997 [Acer saccharum]|nr:hypothetical protein Q3G72_018997 [Acer saccharum]
MDLPCVVESFKTYDDSALVKTGDIGQLIMVREAGDSAPETWSHTSYEGCSKAKISKGARSKLNEHEEDGDASENVPSAPAPEQPDVANGGEPEPERSDSDDSDDS